MANFNSIAPYLSKMVQNDLHETVGITKQPTGDENRWYQIIGGLIFQGGLIPLLATDATAIVTFVMPYPKKVLGIWCQGIGPPDGITSQWVIYNGTITLAQFNVGLHTETISAHEQTAYWWAIGY